MSNLGTSQAESERERYNPSADKLGKPLWDYVRPA
jgi:hypothetical protein